MTIRNLLMAALLISTATLFSAAQAQKLEKNVPKDRSAKRVRYPENKITALPDLTLEFLWQQDHPSKQIGMTVVNKGKGAAGPSVLQIYVNTKTGNKVINRRITTLKPGQKVPVTFNFEYEIESYYGTVDAKGEVKESCEDNNEHHMLGGSYGGQKCF